MNSSKTTGSTSTSSNRHSSSNNNSSSGGTGNNSSNNKNSATSANNKSNSLKASQQHGTAGGPNNNNSGANNNNNNNNNSTHTSNGLNIGGGAGGGGNGGGHNSSPILPMTPSTSVSPPINVICKKEVSSYHSSSNGSVGENLKTSPYDTIKESELGIHHTSAYANINARLGQGGGNLTPLGSNSSIMTTPSPPITPQASHNPLSYVPNHESYTNFWHNQYNNYPNNAYNGAYYQMDYFQNQSQSNYNMSHSGYSTSNFGLTSSSSLSGAMGAQAFSPNLDYMSPQDKYVNMV